MRTTISLSLSDESLLRLDVLRRKTCCTNTQVIANALRLYEALILEDEQGTKFLAQKGEGEPVLYLMFKQ